MGREDDTVRTAPASHALCRTKGSCTSVAAPMLPVGSGGGHAGRRACAPVTCPLTAARRMHDLVRPRSTKPTQRDGWGHVAHGRYHTHTSRHQSGAKRPCTRLFHFLPILPSQHSSPARDSNHPPQPHRRRVRCTHTTSLTMATGSQRCASRYEFRRRERQP